MDHIPKVAIQGDRASFHEIAANRYYQYPIELVYCQSFEEVFALLTAGRVDKAFVAVSNNNHGKIEAVERLLEEVQPVTEGEYLLPLQQHVIGLPGTDLQRVRRVLSHPIAFSQCSEYVRRHFANAVRQEYHDTAAAVAFVKRQADPTIVAIGSEAAAQFYGLAILRRAVQNDPDNATLFRSVSMKYATISRK